MNFQDPRIDDPRRDPALPRCRWCSSTQVKPRGQFTWYCGHCDATMLERELIHEAQPVKRRNAGSGVIAGPIKIGRGSNWKA